MTDASSIDPLAILPRFGLTNFRPGQQDVIAAVLAGEDCLCVMPTGGGKSLCYQLPAVAMNGLTLVVSPLIALMKDQVDQLQSLGINATLINSTLSAAETYNRLDMMRAGVFNLVYVVPERFRSPRFVDAVKAVGLKRLAIDEAHCISEWGHDFRHDYMRLGKFRQMLGSPPTIALTATATEDVRKDIVEQLGLRDPRIFITGFSRPNLHYGVKTPGTNSRKDDDLVEFLGTHPGSGIIYATTRKRCEEVAEYVRGATKRTTGVYHAGMPTEDRHRAQEEFMSGRTEIVVATTAFGMGIDKADVRFVVHYNLPSTIEGYYQEAGRAGRDGAMSDCLLLFSHGDLRIQEFFIESAYPDRGIVREVYEYLRMCPNDPIELTQQELKEALKLQISSEGIGTCEQLLDKAGALERLESRENMAIVRLESDLHSLVDLLPKQAKVQRRVLHAIERVVGARRFETVYFQPREIMLETELDGASLTRTLRELCQLKAFDYVPPFRGRAIHMLKRDTPFEALEIDFARLEQRKAAQYRKLSMVVDFAQSRDCREQLILRYFGQKDGAPCGHCDNCERRGHRKVAGVVAVADQPQRIDDAVRMALAGVARTYARFGKTVVAQMLCGSKSAKIQKFNLQRLSTYALFEQFKQDDVVELLDALLSSGYLEQLDGEGDRPRIQVSQRGNEVMFSREAVGPLSLRPELVERFRKLKAPASEKAAVVAEVQNVVVAERAPSPAVAVAPASTPSIVAPPVATAPSTALAASTLQPAEVSNDAASHPATAENFSTSETKPAHYWTWRLLDRGFTLDECVAIRGVARELILDHALRAIDSGWPVEARLFLSGEQIAAFETIIGPDDPTRIRPLLDRLPHGTRYEDVQLFLKCRRSRGANTNRQ